MAQSVGPYDGRLHTDALLAGTKLVGKTLAGLQPVLDAADPRIFRPQEVGGRWWGASWAFELASGGGFGGK